MTSSEKMFTLIISQTQQLIDSIALLILVFSVSQLIYKFFKLPKIKDSFSLSNKHYHQLRSRFIHRIILALDLFLVSDLIKIAYTTELNTLLQILLIVVIRTILSYFLLQEIKFHR